MKRVSALRKRAVLVDSRGNVIQRLGPKSGPGRYKRVKFLELRGGVKVAVAETPRQMGLHTYQLLKLDGTPIREGGFVGRPRVIPDSALIVAEATDKLLIDARAGEVVGKYRQVKPRWGTLVARKWRGALERFANEFLLLSRDTGRPLSQHAYARLAPLESSEHLIGELLRTGRRSYRNERLPVVLVSKRTGGPIGSAYWELREKSGVLVGAPRRMSNPRYSLVDPTTGKPMTEPIYRRIKVGREGIEAETDVARYLLDRRTGRPIERVAFKPDATQAEIREERGRLPGIPD